MPTQRGSQHWTRRLPERLRGRKPCWRPENRHRIARGEQASNAKLTEASVRMIRSLRREGHTMQAIANRFGLSRSTVWQIVHRITWTHIA